MQWKKIAQWESLHNQEPTTTSERERQDLINRLIKLERESFGRDVMVCSHKPNPKLQKFIGLSRITVEEAVPSREDETA